MLMVYGLVCGQCIQIPERRMQTRQNLALISGTQGQDERQWEQSKIQEVPSEHQKTLLCSESDQALTQLLGEMWSLSHWRSLKATWTWSWSTYSCWHFLTKESGLMTARDPFNHTVIPWFRVKIIKKWQELKDAFYFYHMKLAKLYC